MAIFSVVTCFNYLYLVFLSLYSYTKLEDFDSQLVNSILENATQIVRVLLNDLIHNKLRCRVASISDKRISRSNSELFDPIKSNRLY